MKVKDFLTQILQNKDFFATGVPDSQLKALVNYLMATSDGRWRGEAKRRDGGSFLQIKIVPNAPRKGGGDSNSARSLSSNG